MSDDSHVTQMLFQAACLKSEAASAELDWGLEIKRPFMLLKPRIFTDGNQWCVLLGDNVQDGVSGFGDTPAQAAKDFDYNWMNAKAGQTAKSVR